MLVYRCVLVILFVSICYTKCPVTMEAWMNRKQKCNSGLEYHCLKTDQNYTTEMCIPGKSYPAGVCPLLSNGTMISENCTYDGCPMSGYLTHELYQYPVCFGDNNIFHLNETTGTTRESSKFSSMEFSNRSEQHRATHIPDTTPVTKGKKHKGGIHRNYIIFGGVVAVVVLLNLGVITFCCVKKRRRRLQKISAEIPQAGSISIMSQLYDHMDINPCNSSSMTMTFHNEETHVYSISENEDVYNHLQTRRIILDQPILYDND